MDQASRLTVVHFASQEQVRQLGELPCFRSAFQPWLLLMYQTAWTTRMLAMTRQQWFGREAK